MESKFKLNTLDYQKIKDKLSPAIKNAYAKPYTATIFSFLAIALFGWYAIRPTIQTILFLRREIADKQVVSQKMEDKISALITAQSNLDAVQDQIPLIDQALPVNSQPLDLTNQIKNLADISGASISGVQIAAVPLYTGSASANLKNIKQQSFPITVIISGTFANIHDFIAGLINMRRIVTIENMNISHDTSTVKQANALISQATQLRLLVRLSSFYLGK